MQLDIVTNEIGLVLEELMNFIQNDEEVKQDFNEYASTMGGLKHNTLMELAVPYIFERNIPEKNCSIIELYLRKHETLPEEARNLLIALQSPISSIFEIKKNLKNGFELLNLVNEKTYEAIYPFKMTNLRGLGVGQFLVARLFNFEDATYIIDISGALSSTKKTDAMRFAVAKIIQEPHLVYMDNPLKEKEIEENVKMMNKKFIEAFGSDMIFTTSNHSDEIVSMFNEYTEDGTPVNLEGKIEEPKEYKYFEVKDYNTNYNNFIENSVTGYYNKQQIYDIAVTFQPEEGLYIVPFYKSLERILTSDNYEEIENYDKCIKYFVEAPTISARILTDINNKYPKFTEIANKVLGENLSFDEILKKYKDTKHRVFSHTTILYNSNVFSSTLTDIVDTKKKEGVDYSNVKRNDPCPCGSGKKYKNCCLNK